MDTVLATMARIVKTNVNKGLKCLSFNLFLVHLFCLVGLFIVAVAVVNHDEL